MPVVSFLWQRHLINVNDGQVVVSVDVPVQAVIQLNQFFRPKLGFDS